MDKINSMYIKSQIYNTQSLHSFIWINLGMKSRPMLKKYGSGQKTVAGSYVDFSVKLGNFLISSVSTKALISGTQYNPSMEGTDFCEI